nr:hypothetical protein [Acidobacteriota bacterium]
ADRPDQPLARIDFLEPQEPNITLAAQNSPDDLPTLWGSDQVWDDAFESLLPLRRAGASRTLFCIHPAGGLSWCYTALLPYIDKTRPVYGLQSPLFSSAQNAAQSIDALAARYVQLIRLYQPVGPYHLLGWSLGGLIAQSMATQLQADGQDVGFLCLLDCHLHRESSEKREMEIGSSVAMRDYIEQHWQQMLSTDQRDIIVSIFHQHLAMAEHFRPSVYSGDVLFLVATADRDSYPLTSEEKWEDYVQGDIHYCAVPVCHKDMLKPAACSQYASAIAADLAWYE